MGELYDLLKRELNRSRTGRRLAPAGPSMPKDPLRRYVVPFGKGLGQSVGLPMNVQPGERAIAGAGQFVGTAAQFIPLVRGAGLALRAAPLVSRLAARPLVGLALQSGLAAGAQESLKQVVHAATSQEVRPEAVGREAAIGAAVPAALGGLGKAVGGAVRLIPGAEKFHLGPSLGKVVARMPVVGKAYDRFATGASYLFQTRERYFSLHGSKHDIQGLLNDLQRGVNTNVAGPGRTPIVAVINGPRSPRGARAVAKDVGSEAQRLAQLGQTHQDPHVRAAAQEAAKALGTATSRLNYYAKRGMAVPSDELSEVAGAIDHIANLRVAAPATAAMRQKAKQLGPNWLTAELGFQKPTGGLNIEGQYLAFIRDTLVYAKPGRNLEKFIRGGIAHIFLGVGNVGSFLVNASAIITNVGAKEGPTATARAIQEYTRNSPLARQIANYVALSGRASPRQGIELGSRGARASMYLFSKGEDAARTIAGIARFINTRSMREAQNAARQELFDFQWNLPAFLGGTRFGSSLMRVLFQFYPFAINQANFMASLNGVEFARFLAYQTALAGTLGLPFARVADRVVASYTGWSILDRLSADPRLWAQLVGEGPVAAATGASVGRRLDFTSDLMGRWLNLGDAPWQQFITDLGDGLRDGIADPTPENLLRVAGRLMPMSIKRLEEATQAEEVGAFTTQRGLPVAPVTEQSLTVKALGFTPVEQAAGQAATGIQIGIRERGRNQTEFWLRELRLASQAKDQDRLRRAIRELVKAGYRREDIVRELRLVRLSPTKRLERGVQRRLRPQFKELVGPLQEQEREP